MRILSGSFRHRLAPALASVCVLGSVYFFTSPAFAESGELQIYAARIAERGESDVEIKSAIIKSAVGSETKGRSVFQSFIEYGYGFTENLEAGFKLPVTHVEGNWYGNGLIGEVKYIAPHSNKGGYWGAEIEIGNTTPFQEKRQWGLELVPILGYRTALGEVIVNPGLSIASDGDVRHVVMFEPSGKIACQLNEKNALGLEYFVEAGPLKSVYPRDKRSEIALLAWDTKAGQSTINVGLGRGTTATSPRRLAKVNIDIEFD